MRQAMVRWKQFPPAASPVWQGERYGHDRIRVAYLSADFRQHPVGMCMAGVRVS